MNHNYCLLDDYAQGKQNTRLNILLVEDDKCMQMIYQNFCKRLNHRVYTVSTAGEALKQFNCDSYDLILLDLGLPDRSGEYVLSSIRQKEKDKNLNSVPIFITTAHNDLELTARCYQQHASLILSKPVSFPTFYKLLTLYSQPNFSKR